MFQNSSEFKDVLDTQYKFFMRNSDAFTITMGFQSSTPEIKVTNGQADLLGHVDIAPSDVSVSQKVKMDNPDSNAQIVQLPTEHDVIPVKPLAETITLDPLPPPLPNLHFAVKELLSPPPNPVMYHTIRRFPDLDSY